MNFIGLFDMDKTKRIRSIKLCDFDEVCIQSFAVAIINNNNQNQDRRAENPYLVKIQLTPENRYYIIALKKETTDDIYKSLKGIEEYIKEHLSIQLSDSEWEQRAIKILITWNLSEKKELEDFKSNAEGKEEQFKTYSLVFLGLGLISLIIKYSIKLFI